MKRARYLNGDRWADLGEDQRDIGLFLAFGLLVLCFIVAPYYAMKAILEMDI